MKIGPEIIVEVTLDYFVFSEGKKQLRLDTCMNLAIDNGETIPVSIGENKGVSDATLVYLFKPNPTNPKWEKQGLLQAFMEYGIGKIFEERRFPPLRPLIIFKNDVKLSELLCGYQKGILEYAAMSGGAREVRFE